MQVIPWLRVVLKTLLNKDREQEEEPNDYCKTVMVVDSWTKGQRSSVVHIATTVHSDWEEELYETLEQVVRGSWLERDGEAGTGTAAARPLLRHVSNLRSDPNRAQSASTGRPKAPYDNPDLTSLAGFPEEPETPLIPDYPEEEIQKTEQGG